MNAVSCFKLWTAKIVARSTLHHPRAIISYGFNNITRRQKLSVIWACSVSQPVAKSSISQLKLILSPAPSWVAVTDCHHTERFVQNLITGVWDVLCDWWIKESGVNTGRKHLSRQRNERLQSLNDLVRTYKKKTAHISGTKERLVEAVREMGWWTAHSDTKKRKRSELNRVNNNTNRKQCKKKEIDRWNNGRNTN